MVNDRMDTVMRLACGLALALWLSSPAVAVWPQEPAGAANAAAQVPAAPVPADRQSSVQAPARRAPAAEQKTAEQTEKKQAASVATGGSKKRRKRTTPVLASAQDGDPAQDAAPRKTVVREGGAREPAAQIVPDITPAEAARQRQNAEQWLGSTDGQLQRLAGRTLNPGQQETVGQIRNYMEGARSALKEGDVRRAGTLAQKAHLLAEDLARR